jgi:hypothetical protein
MIGSTSASPDPNEQQRACSSEQRHERHSCGRHSVCYIVLDHMI